MKIQSNSVITKNSKDIEKNYRDAHHQLVAEILSFFLQLKKNSPRLRRRQEVSVVTVLQILDTPVIKQIYSMINNNISKIASDSNEEIPKLLNTGLLNNTIRLVAWLEDKAGSYQTSSLVDLLITDIMKVIIQSASRENRSLPFQNLCSGLQALKSVLPLSEEQIALLGVLYLIKDKEHQDDPIEFLDNLSPQSFIQIIAKASGLPQRTFQKEFSQNSQLNIFGLFESSALFGRGKMSISDELMDILIFNRSPEAVFSKSMQRYAHKVHALNTFEVRDEKKDLIKKLLQKNKRAQILLYGEPGTGKTEFARTISRAANRTIYELESLNAEERTRRSSQYMLASVILARKNDNSVLVVDEADEILNAPTFWAKRDAMGKAQLNRMLDNVCVPTIWIVNHTGDIDNSVKRRFDFVLHFDQLSKSQIFTALQTLIRRYKLSKVFRKEDLMALSEKFSATPGVFDRYLASLHEAGGMREEIKQHLELMLEEYAKLAGKNIDSNLAKASKVYDPSFTNCHPGLPRVKTYLEKIRHQFMNKKTQPGDGANILLHGPPGTGKTEFIRWLGKEFDCRVVLKRGSDLMNPFVGMTEKLIARMFKEASEPNTILLVDEADSFFTRRENARASWEVKHTNEFLNQMENHKGIVFYCTNFEKNLDPAAMRRFNWKVQFDYPDVSQREGLILAYFDFVKPTMEEMRSARKTIATLEGLTPGDIAAVKKRTLFETDLSLSDILAELQIELKYKEDDVSSGKKIGF